MLDIFIRVVGAINGGLFLIFIAALVYLYHGNNKNNHDAGYKIYRLQMLTVFLIHFLSFSVLTVTSDYSKDILLIFLGSLGLLILTNTVVDHWFDQTCLPIWSIVQLFVVISFAILTRLNHDLGKKQLYIVATAYLITFLVVQLYRRFQYSKYLAFPSVAVAYTLLIMANNTINGAQNWFQFKSISFQPSEIVKVLYIIFLAGILTMKKIDIFTKIVLAGLLTSGLIFIQVFRRDLGSALIFYVVYILMSYVYTKNRNYIIGGFFLTAIGGALAYNYFSHVRIRVEAWIDPWADITGNGYQIVQSLFALGNGGLFGSGLTLGNPQDIPIVYTDFIYSAIFEELGMIVGIGLIVAILYLLLFGLDMVEQVKDDFDFYLGSGLLMILSFQSFLIIAGVTKLVPLTGVTLPFISSGGSSLVSSFIMLSLLQGIALKNRVE